MIAKKRYFESDLIAYLSASGEPKWSDDGRIAVYVARHYGFCHGVIRAIRMALDTTEKYPERRIYLLGQIIHNPFVNDQLRQRGVTIVEDADELLAVARPEDVVIIPAFGVAAPVMVELQRIGCTVVDTACGEVMSVWKRIGRYNASGFTTVIHGKFAHQETIATASRASRYIVVRDLEEARLIADFIRDDQSAQAETIVNRFRGAYSPGFDPHRDLQRVGMAAQTTMYANEFLQVSATIRSAIVARYGTAANEHFQELDTICSATQERQDAIRELARRVDVVVVVGGYNSSNTGNVTRVAQEHVPAYHIQGPGQISASAVRHQPVGSRQETTTADWLPHKPVIAIGLSSGASTPDSVVEEVLNELLCLTRDTGQLSRAGPTSPG